MFSDIVQPEVAPLRVGVGGVGPTHALDLLQQRAIGQGRATQFGPVLPPAAPDHVVDRGEREVLMIEMSVEHGGKSIRPEQMHRYDWRQQMPHAPR